jgi:hypothetical protein
LHFFLGRAPFPLRVLAFLFFSATLAVLGVYLAGAMAYGDGIAAALEELRGKHTLSTLGIVAASLINHPISHANRKEVHADWSLGGSRNFREARGTKGSIGLWMWCWWCR